MDEHDRINHTSGMNPWRAGCGGSRTSGSEGGPEKPTRRKPDRALRPDPYTQHPTDEGRVYLAVVLDAWNRQVIGQSIADHLRAELVVDALDMACWRRRPTAGETIHHADHGTQYTSWAFGQRLRHAGLLGSMGTVGDALDNAVAESFFATLQTELLDRQRWTSRRQLSQASSSGSRSSTTRNADTPPSACSTPSPITEPAAAALRHDHPSPHPR
jgi:putative transposase